MKREHSSLFCAFSLIPLVPLVYVAIVLGIEARYRSDDLALLLGDALTALILATAWVMIWRKRVRWTARRRLLTLVSVCWSAGPAVLMYGYCSVLFPYWDDVGIVLGGLCWAGCWILSTGLIWRETLGERAERLGGEGRPIRCPKCGYDLTGLYEARCPECGTRFTVDALARLAAESP